VKLALPAAPRKVRLGQVPGARVRIGAAVALLLLAAGLFAAAERRALTRARAERAAFARRVAVEGRVLQARLDGEAAVADVLYEVDGRGYSARGIAVRVEGRPLGHGARLALSVDPAAPDAPLEARFAAREAARIGLPLWGLSGAGGLLLLFLLGWTVALIRREPRALRSGLLVWATPADPQAPLRFGRLRGRYFLRDVEFDLCARARRGRGLVRNGEKVLAAVVPGRPRQAWVVDEALAASLGWTRE
jgi:hypothetical protein